MDEKSKELIIQNIPFFRQLSENFKSYQVTNIDLNRIIYFVAQFENYDRIRIIIELLKNIDFIDSNKMTYLLKKAYDKIPTTLLSKPIISSLGSIQDSSAVVCYQLLKQLFDSEKDSLSQIVEINSIAKYIKEQNPSVIIFFDDNITSGTQLSEFFKELIDGSEKAELVKTKLTAEEYESLKTIPIRICYAIQLSEESNAVIKDIKEKYNLDLEICCGKFDFSNYLDYESSTMKSEDEAKFARNFIREISEQLYNDKDWSKETIYHRLLGYGNLGKLTAFYYNIPKSFIPVFWKFGFIKHKPWIPLFPETQEQKKIIKGAIDYDYFQLEAIKGWIGSVHQNRKPSIAFGFHFLDGPIKHISIDIPSKEYVIREFLSKLTLNDLIPLPNSLVSNPQDINEMIRNIYPTQPTKLTESNYESYKQAISHYNEKLNEYRIAVEEYILRFSSITHLNFLIFNSGNIASTNCVVKLIYNTGKILINEFDELEKPIFETEIPQIKYFDKLTNYARIVSSNSSLTDIAALLGKKNKEPFEANTNYEFKIFNNIRVGHNDGQTRKIELTLMDSTKESFEIPYEINYDEEADTIEGVLKISVNKTESIHDKLREDINKSIQNFKKLHK